MKEIGGSSPQVSYQKDGLPFSAPLSCGLRHGTLDSIFSVKLHSPFLPSRGYMILSILRQGDGPSSAPPRCDLALRPKTPPFPLCTDVFRFGWSFCFRASTPMLSLMMKELLTPSPPLWFRLLAFLFFLS